MGLANVRPAASRTDTTPRRDLMTNCLKPRWRGATMRALITAALLCGAADARATEPEASPPAPGDSQEARAILNEMATFLAAQKGFSVEIAAAHDTVQASGQKIEFLDKRKLTVRRPHDLRIEVEGSDGEQSEVVMNSRTITAQTVSGKKYAQTEAKASLDDSVAYFLKDLRMRLPLAMLLVTTLPQQLEKRLVQAEIVEDTDILGTPTTHISGSTDTVDFQIWVGDGKKPLPYRIVLTYRDAEGQPQFRANFSDWEVSPWISSSTFEPKIAKGAERIAFLTQVKAALPAPGDAAGNGAK